MPGSGGPADFEQLGRWPGILARLVRGDSLGAEEAESALGQVLSGQATPAQIAGFAVALRAKGETVEEMTGLVRAMLAHAVPLDVDGDLLDVVGTGGDRLGSINVSTLAALIAAGAGARVCKHGNRAATSSVGTADVLEALGVAVDLPPAGVRRCVDEVGMGFCFAPRYHTALRHAGPVRSELGIPTVFNYLGPLSNPARARHQLLGVSNPAMAATMAGVLGANGSRHAYVVYADDGLDELSVVSPSTVLEVTAATPPPGTPPAATPPPGTPPVPDLVGADLAGEGVGYEVRTWRLDPTELGFARATMEDLRGGDAAFNARAIHRVLEGTPGPHRDIGILNAAAALVVVGLAEDVRSGVTLASASIDKGRAARVLADLARVSNEAAEQDGAG